MSKKKLSKLDNIHNEIDKNFKLKIEKDLILPKIKEKIKDKELIFKKEDEVIYEEVSEKVESKIKKIPSAVERDISKHEEQVVVEKSHSDLIRTLEILSNPHNLEGNTILTNAQVVALSMMNWAGQVYDIQFFKHFVKLFPRYRISGDDGRGRKELIQIAEAIRRDKEQEQNRFMELLGRR